MIKYIFSDMDGTLLDEQKHLPKQLFPLLEILKRKGVRFGIASGRQYYNLHERFPGYGDDMLFIAENGAMMFEGRNCVFYSEIAKTQLIQPIQRIRQAERIWPVLCGVNCAYVEHDDPLFLENCRMYYQRLRIVDDVLAASAQDSICKISLYDALHTQTHGLPWMRGFTNDLHTVISGAHWIDMTNPEVNKGSAVAYLKAQRQIAKAELMAFGDYLNDLELLAECEESYAMANAHPDIKCMAKHITKSNEENGVVEAICDYFRIPKTIR